MEMRDEREVERGGGRRMLPLPLSCRRRREEEIWSSSRRWRLFIARRRRVADERYTPFRSTFWILEVIPRNIVVCLRYDCAW